MTQLTHQYLNLKPRLQNKLQRQFPQQCTTLIEDAIAQTYLNLHTNPTPFNQALSNDPNELYKLLYCISWCNMRGYLRRKSTRNEISTPELPPVHIPPAQELLTDIHRKIPTLLHEAAQNYGGNHKYTLYTALMDRTLSGDPDKDVAARHGLNRETLNRAKRFIQQELFEAA